MTRGRPRRRQRAKIHLSLGVALLVQLTGLCYAQESNQQAHLNSYQSLQNLREDERLVTEAATDSSASRPDSLRVGADRDAPRRMAYDAAQDSNRETSEDAFSAAASIISLSASRPEPAILHRSGSEREVGTSFSGSHVISSAVSASKDSDSRGDGPGTASNASQDAGLMSDDDWTTPSSSTDGSETAPTAATVGVISSPSAGDDRSTSAGNTTTTPHPSSGNRLSTPAIAGIVMGCVAALVAVTVVIALCKQRLEEHRQEEQMFFVDLKGNDRGAYPDALYLAMQLCIVYCIASNVADFGFDF